MVAPPRLSLTTRRSRVTHSPSRRSNLHPNDTNPRVHPAHGRGRATSDDGEVARV